MRIALPAIAVLALAAGPAVAIEVDGVISPGEWDQARHLTDFRLTQPLSREPAPYPTEAWVMATPEGLAIGWRNTQPASVPRTRQRSQRDQGGAADRVNLYVDFDGDGRTGYNFTLLLSGSIVDATITNENQFNGDWDGDWRHATSEEGDTWSAEILLPWHIAPMQEPEGDVRTIGISLDRVVGVTGERMSWPAIGFNEQRFLSVLEEIQVPRYSQALLAITPYVVGLGDLVGTFRSDMVFANAGVTWLVDQKQELRVRLEALGLDARASQAFRVQDDGTPLAVDEPLEDFALRNLGFQVRYRYELAPLSYLYVAYVRGGSLYEQGMGPFDSAGRLLADAFDLRDSEQLLVKLSYRFEI